VLIGRDRRGQAHLGEHVVVHDVDEVSVEAEHVFASGGFGADFQAVVGRESMSAPRSVSIALRSNRFEPANG
jgi:hypothetical protein